jgi:hypothetical protein
LASLAILLEFDVSNMNILVVTLPFMWQIKHFDLDIKIQEHALWLRRRAACEGSVAFLYSWNDGSNQFLVTVLLLDISV